MHIHKSRPDLKFNVAQLLREEVGARREYQFSEPVLELDDTLALRDLEGSVKFTRTASGVLADVAVHSTVEMECIRCLKPSVQDIAIQFYDQFHSRIEVNTGLALPPPDEDDPFFIDELHMVDLAVAIREYALIELPMQPLCAPDCKGLCPHCGVDRNVEQCNCSDSEGDERFAALRSLLSN
jgi:uncharacterized protein